MTTVAMRCDCCEVEIHGRYRQTEFDALSGEDLAFLEEYLLAEFSIKNLAQTSTLGYTAIRSRLDRIIATYRRLRENETAKRAILEKLEQGRITAKEASEALTKLG